MHFTPTMFTSTLHTSRDKRCGFGVNITSCLYYIAQNAATKVESGRGGSGGTSGKTARTVTATPTGCDVYVM